MAVGDGSGPIRLKVAARIVRGHPAWLQHRRPRPSPVLGPFLWLADDKKPGALAGNGRKTQVRILAARFARGLSERFALSFKRAWGMPDARCTRSLVCAIGSKYAHEYSQRATGITRHSRTQWFTAYNALSPATGFLATVASGVASTDLTPASGCQDHTSSPSVSWQRRPRAAT